MEEDSDTEENGREMLGEAYKKSNESFREERRAKQRGSVLCKTLSVSCKALDNADKQIAEVGNNDLLSGQKFEALGLFGVALEKYKCAAELGNAQAELCFDALYKKIISAPSPANASYEYALRCEKDGRKDVAIALYEQAAKLGSEQAMTRLQDLSQEYAALNNYNDL